MDPKQVADMFVEAGWIRCRSGPCPRAGGRDHRQTDRGRDGGTRQSSPKTSSSRSSPSPLARRSSTSEHVRRRIPHPPPSSRRARPTCMARFPSAMRRTPSMSPSSIRSTPQIAEDLRFALGREIQVVVAPSSKVRDLIFAALRSRSLHHRGRSCPTRGKHRNHARRGRRRPIQRAGRRAGSQRRSDHSLR